MYGKVFEQMYHGSMAVAGWEAIVTMQQLIVLANRHGEVDMTPNAISNLTTIPLDIITKGLAILGEPDKYSRSKAEEGRRIVPIDPERPWGWILVNYQHYANLANKEDKREKDAERMSEKRKEINDVANSRRESQIVAESRRESQIVEKVAYVNVNVNVSTDIKTSQFMFDLIRSLNPKHREPNFESWANDIRLMRERDGRTDADIRSLFGWANKHHFWKTNILSPTTLRKQWDKLVIQRDNSGGNNGPHQHTGRTSVAERATEARKQFEEFESSKRPPDG